MVRNIPRSDAEKHRRLIVESLLIHEKFPFLKTRIVGDRLICRGKIRPTPGSSEYRIEVCYKPWGAPGVRILEPDIRPQAKLHFYKEGTLCLYDWREQPWEKGWRLADTVIPWTSEWILYYELYLLTGEWLGESALHGDAKEAEPEVAQPVDCDGSRSV